MSAEHPFMAPLVAPVPLSPVSSKLLHPSRGQHVKDPSHAIVMDEDDGEDDSSSPFIPSSSIALSTTPPSLLSSPRAYFFSLLPTKAQTFISQNIGLSFVASAQLFFVLMNLTVKYFLSATRISALTLIFVRMGITGCFCIASLAFIVNDPNPILGPPGIRKMLVLRGVWGFVGLLSGYQSLRGLTVSDSISIQFLAPTVTAVLGYLFLKEKMTWREVVAGLCCLVGVILVSRPPFLFGRLAEDQGGVNPGAGMGAGNGTRLELPLPPGEGDTEGIVTPGRAISVCWALVLVMSTSLAMITIRSIGNKANALHSIAYFSYMCTTFCGLYLLLDPHPIVWVESVRDFLFIVAIGIFGFTAQTLLTLGLQREKAGRAGIATYLQVVFALVLEFVLWQTIPSLLSACGTAIILVSAFWAAASNFKTQNTTKPTDEEAMPFSRSPSPIPPPQSNRPTLRGEHYSYDSVPQHPSAEDVEPTADSINADRAASANDHR
ncbi:hypothetical protein IAU60_004438 [Kwoniella sp. DSM 27419]